MKIALFGGRFDPVHNGHMAIAKEALGYEYMDELWFIPDNIHQWNPIIASAQDRLKMLQLAIRIVKNEKLNAICYTLYASDIAIRLGGQTNTMDIVNKLRKENPHDSFIFLCGSDQIKNFHKWNKWDKLQKTLDFLIIPRVGFPITDLPPNCRVLSDKAYHPLDDASTIIRNRLKIGKSIAGLVPKAVEEYIIEKGLYK